MIAWASGLVVVAMLGAPTIDEVLPAPLPRGALAEIRGAGFVPGTTSVTVGGIEQALVLSQETTLRFFVASVTPLGAQPLVVANGSDTAQIPVEVAPPLPRIERVVPATLVVGAPATLEGESLAAVTAITLDGVTCAIVTRTDVAIAFEVPFDPSLLGRSRLELTSPSGTSTRDVDVVAPAPTITSVSPSPARAGDLLVVRGKILPLAPEVRLGTVVAPTLAVETIADVTSVTVWVPWSLAPGSYSVIVSAAGIASSPGATLIVQAASASAPRVDAVYPARVAAGGAFFVVGEGLATITRATAGVTVDGCDARVCRLQTTGLSGGPPFVAAITGPHGASTFQVELVDEPAREARIVSVDPIPARRGLPLTIVADHVTSVRSVLLGGVTQTIDFFDEERIVVIVSPATPLGAEQMFLVSNVGSDFFTMTVLDPVPEPGPEAVVEEAADAERVVVERADDGGGCAGGSTSMISMWLVLAGLTFAGAASTAGRRAADAAVAGPLRRPSGFTWRRRASPGSSRTRP